MSHASERGKPPNGLFGIARHLIATRPSGGEMLRRAGTVSIRISRIEKMEKALACRVKGGAFDDLAPVSGSHSEAIDNLRGRVQHGRARVESLLGAKGHADEPPAGARPLHTHPKGPD